MSRLTTYLYRQWQNDLVQFPCRLACLEGCCWHQGQQCPSEYFPSGWLCCSSVTAVRMATLPNPNWNQFGSGSFLVWLPHKSDCQATGFKKAGPLIAPAKSNGTDIQNPPKFPSFLKQKWHQKKMYPYIGTLSKHSMLFIPFPHGTILFVRSVNALKSIDALAQQGRIFCHLSAPQTTAYCTIAICSGKFELWYKNMLVIC